MSIQIYEKRLLKVQRAISDILSGAQEASYNGQRVRKADLEQLLKYEKQLETLISRKKRGGIRVRGATPI